MRKFFVKSNQINDNYISIIDEDVNHIKNVLRLAIGEKIKITVERNGKEKTVNVELQTNAKQA